MNGDKYSKLQLSDEALMQEYKLGNLEAFQVLYERHMTKVYGYLTNKLQSKSQIDDVFQECFLRVHRYRSRYDPTFPFLPWLFTICRNAMVDNLRQVARRKEEVVADAPEIPTLSPEPSLAEGIMNLSAKEEKVIDLHYLKGYSFTEVAAFLKIQPSAARKISSRAIAKLKKFIGQDNE